VADAVRNAVADALPPTTLLTNDPAGATILVVGTNTNFGTAQAVGADLAVEHRFTDRWMVAFNYSWLDAEKVRGEEHYEVFGGDLLGRRVLTSLTVDW
jgi:hypothetical protein